MRPGPPTKRTIPLLACTTHVKPDEAEPARRPRGPAPQGRVPGRVPAPLRRLGGSPPPRKAMRSRTSRGTPHSRGSDLRGRLGSDLATFRSPCITPRDRETLAIATIFPWSRLGDLNPGPTHYEPFASPLRPRSYSYILRHSLLQSSMRRPCSGAYPGHFATPRCAPGLRIPAGQSLVMRQRSAPAS